MFSIKTEIKTKMLSKTDNYVWSLDDFTKLPRINVQKAFSLLEKENFIKRIKRGYYYVPKKTILGNVPYDKHCLAVARIKKRSSFYCYSGLTGYNMLGFTTQMTNVITISCDYKVRNYDGVIYLYRKKVIDGGNNERVVLDLINDIKIIPDTTVEDCILHIKDLIKSKKVDIVSLVKTAIDKKNPQETPRVKAVVGAIAQELKVCNTLLIKLKSTLNPTTKIFLNVNNSLPMALNWNIVNERTQI